MMIIVLITLTLLCACYFDTKRVSLTDVAFSLIIGVLLALMLSSIVTLLIPFKETKVETEKIFIEEISDGYYVRVEDETSFLYSISDDDDNKLQFFELKVNGRNIVEIVIDDDETPRIEKSNYRMNKIWRLFFFDFGGTNHHTIFVPEDGISIK